MRITRSTALPVLAPSALGLALLVAGCGPTPQINPGALGAQTAYFASYPADLLTAAASACNRPEQTARRPARGTVICETLPSPDSAAALILAHDGTIDALPSYIIGFQTRSAAEGYLVTADSYIRVPQFDGGVAQIRLPDEQVADTMRDLLVGAGGTMTAP